MAWRGSHNGEDQPVVQALVVALDVIMRNELADRAAERRLPDENYAVQTGFLDAPSERAREERIPIVIAVHPLTRCFRAYRVGGDSVPMVCSG